MRLKLVGRLILVAAVPAACLPRTTVPPARAPLSDVIEARDTLAIHVRVEAARHEVVVVAGPFQVPAGGHEAEHDEADRTPLVEFDWPVDGWIRGFRILIFDAEGQELPRDIMHHLIGYNFSRRQLVHPGVERLFGIGAETRDIVLRPRVGVPLSAGSRLGFDAVWHNETGQALDGVYVRVALVYTPPRPKGIAFEGFPFHVDVNYSVAGSNEFDVPPGHSEHSVEFVMPIDGRLIGIGGHLHEYGVSLRLEDARMQRVLFRLRATPDAASRVAVRQKVFRKWLGLRDARLRLDAGRRYRLVAEYDNPTGEPIEGAMAHIAGLFAPDDASDWPPLDLTEPDIQEDIAVLRGEKPRQRGRPHDHTRGQMQ
jgi:hypothetical protein